MVYYSIAGFAADHTAVTCIADAGGVLVARGVGLPYALEEDCSLTIAPGVWVTGRGNDCGTSPSGGFVRLGGFRTVPSLPSSGRFARRY